MFNMSIEILVTTMLTNIILHSVLVQKSCRIRKRVRESVKTTDDWRKLEELYVFIRPFAHFDGKPVTPHF